MTRRRRLLLWSAPVVLLLVVAMIKVSSMVLASHWAAADFARHDADALRSDVATLSVLDVVVPAETSFAAGALAVLDGRLDEADRRFSDVVGTDPTSCPARVNLVLVRETLGDNAVGEGNGPKAIDRYRTALTVVLDAPDGCFASNDDPDTERRAIRAESEARLRAKLAVLERPLPPLPPPPAAAPPPPPAAPPNTAGSSSREPDAPRRLNPESGAALDKLRQLLQDAAAARGAP